jgi:hypothetical protein
MISVTWAPSLLRPTRHKAQSPPMRFPPLLSITFLQYCPLNAAVSSPIAYPQPTGWMFNERLRSHNGTSLMSFNDLPVWPLLGASSTTPRTVSSLFFWQMFWTFSRLTTIRFYFNVPGLVCAPRSGSASEWSWASPSESPYQVGSSRFALSHCYIVYTD